MPSKNGRLVVSIIVKMTDREMGKIHFCPGRPRIFLRRGQRVPSNRITMKALASITAETEKME